MDTMLRLPVDRLGRLSSDVIQRYLVEKGWVIDEPACTALATIYRYPGLDDSEAIVPRRRDLADYVARVSDIVCMVAVVERRHPWEVMEELECRSEAASVFPVDGDVRRCIAGYVVALTADAPVSREFAGTVTVTTDVGGIPARVQVLLNADDYKKACDAHRDWLPVRVNGLLHREAKLYHLTQPRDFMIVSGS